MVSFDGQGIGWRFLEGKIKRIAPTLTKQRHITKHIIRILGECCIKVNAEVWLFFVRIVGCNENILNDILV